MTESLNALAEDDAGLRRLLRDARVIAMVGASPNWVRPSNFAMKYLLGKGYRVVPVNPAAVGQTIWGELVYASLADVPAPVQMVDIFRNSEAAARIVDETLIERERLGVTSVWMQLGVHNDEAARRVRDAGLAVVMDRCVKIEYGRLFGELGWSGVNSRIISAKRPALAP